MQKVVASPGEIEPLARQIRAAADATVRSLNQTLAASSDSLAALRAMKFDQLGRHPLEDRPLNLIEQLNQTATCLVSLRAAALLFDRHPDCGGLRLNLMTYRGCDIESVRPGLIKAEAFAAVKPTNNRKLARDIERLRDVSAQTRAVYFAAPGYAEGRHTDLETVPGVEVWCVEI